MKQAINGLNDMAMMVGALPAANETPIAYNHDNLWKQTEKFKAITVNGKMIQAVNPKYQIVQHNDVAQGVVESLGRKGIEVAGLARVDDKRARFDVYFTNGGTPVTDDADGIKLGIRVVNSYDKSTSFRLELFGYRTICQNGMVLGRALNGIREITMHMGNEKPLDVVKRITEGFIIQAINSSALLQQYVDSAMADSIDSEDSIAVLKLLLKRKKHRAVICEKLGIEMIEEYDKELKQKKFYYVPGKPFTRWDLYNALTEYATHDNLARGVEDQMQNIAQKVLSQKVEQLIEVAQ